MAALQFQTEQREHSAGFSFFGSVGIVLVEITGGTDTAVVNLPNAPSTTLLDDLGGKAGAADEVAAKVIGADI